MASTSLPTSFWGSSRACASSPSWVPVPGPTAAPMATVPLSSPFGLRANTLPLERSRVTGTDAGWMRTAAGVDDDRPGISPRGTLPGGAVVFVSTTRVQVRVWFGEANPRTTNRSDPSDERRPQSYSRVIILMPSWHTFGHFGHVRLG